ncbi:hypothetical protein CVT26_005177 [Gymnopilus dilepis]|uniref:Uncharacterized protein n=1 Tax=Gymnopilus dilepis TaxID=231916 RepID=A0A409WHC8_9AGAR|nr:hypothetical protein CVT26_005177 [Gymnopilus dilepis]
MAVLKIPEVFKTCHAPNGQSQSERVDPHGNLIGIQLFKTLWNAISHPSPWVALLNSPHRGSYHSRRPIITKESDCFTAVLQTLSLEEAQSVQDALGPVFKQHGQDTSSLSEDLKALLDKGDTVKVLSDCFYPLYDGIIPGKGPRSCIIYRDLDTTHLSHSVMRPLLKSSPKYFWKRCHTVEAALEFLLLHHIREQVDRARALNCSPSDSPSGPIDGVLSTNSGALDLQNLDVSTMVTRRRKHGWQNKRSQESEAFNDPRGTVSDQSPPDSHPILSIFSAAEASPAFIASDAEKSTSQPAVKSGDPVRISQSSEGSLSKSTAAFNSQVFGSSELNIQPRIYMGGETSEAWSSNETNPAQSTKPLSEDSPRGRPRHCRTCHGPKKGHPRTCPLLSGMIEDMDRLKLSESVDYPLEQSETTFGSMEENDTPKQEDERSKSQDSQTLDQVQQRPTVPEIFAGDVDPSRFDAYLAAMALLEVVEPLYFEVDEAEIDTIRRLATAHRLPYFIFDRVSEWNDEECITTFVVSHSKEALEDARREL